MACAASSASAIFDGEREKRVHLHRTPGDQVLQGYALEVFHGDERLAALFTDVVNGADVGMVQRRSCLRLALKAAEGLGIPGNFIGQELECDKAMQPRVFGFVNHTHSAAAQLGDNAIVRNGLADHGLANLNLAIVSAQNTEIPRRHVRGGGEASQREEGYIRHEDLLHPEGRAPGCTGIRALHDIWRSAVTIASVLLRPQALDSVHTGGLSMKYRLVFAVIIMLLLTSTGIFAQQDASESSTDVAFWVAYWERPRVVLFVPDEEAFNKNVHEIMFPWNDHDEPSNPNILDDNVQWLKDHPRDRFYIEGYASSRGELIYNLALSQRRADWVKQTLISRAFRRTGSCWRWDGGSCIRCVRKRTMNAGLRIGSSVSLTLQIEIRFARFGSRGLPL